jgi:hypothetical protein
MLNVRESGRRNGIPNKAYFRELFCFTDTELSEYVESRLHIANEVYERSFDQRGTPSFFIEETAGGYNVGWCEGGKGALRFHRRLEDAAVDFVLAMWGRRALG